MSQTESYRWLKFRTKHSSGPSSWQWREIAVYEPVEDEDKFIHSVLEELHYELTTESEHWRGVEEEWENPSADWLKKHVKHLRQEAISIKQQIARSREIIRNSK